MKKLSFFTLCRTRSSIEALHVNGYTDGVFHYYRGPEKWHAVHPETGLSVCTGGSRPAVADLANSSDLLEKVNQALEQHGAEWKQVFSEKVAAFEAAASMKRGA